MEVVGLLTCSGDCEEESPRSVAAGHGKERPAASGMKSRDAILTLKLLIITQ